MMESQLKAILDDCVQTCGLPPRSLDILENTRKWLAPMMEIAKHYSRRYPDGSNEFPCPIVLSVSYQLTFKAFVCVRSFQQEDDGAFDRIGESTAAWYVSTGYVMVGIGAFWDEKTMTDTKPRDPGIKRYFN
jgi:hypothetical protein